ncbi:BTAD domain-containing putative transcriptional regulator [Amycolatopsis granulosa]|uniref:BTAD domain-containing putative transcriptional regulator n=1 Tax=Amycolatopsis granulosa TaxID=185684 RepID=UPI001FBA02AC|nr:BTAD domain-containing putative transcriptional regulator [Amycolatopsis granulosa]NIH83746.1 DNA-binding SARP family transcriptional activator [Amycolatopsis granulosa]
MLATVILVSLLGGVPWALIRFIGWPLPDHLPTLAEIEGVLLGPMTANFLLSSLACLSWVVWALFAVDVARCAIEVARDMRVPGVIAAGPLRHVTAALIGAILIAIVGHRVDHSLTAGTSLSAEVVTTSDVRLVAHEHNSAEGIAAARSVVALAPDPETGVHDSLWRIAQRTLGDGNRWPEIFDLNKGKPQPNGGLFNRPNLIFPGEEFRLPADAATSPKTGPPSTAAPAEQPAPATLEPPAEDTPPPNPGASGEAGFRWGEELFVGLGLASTVSAALLIARRRHRRRYRPGSGDRTDLPVAPVVYQLRLAHLRAADDEPDTTDREPPMASEPPLAQDSTLPVGVRDGREVALDLASVHGIGLIGEGAPAAARALLVAAATATHSGARVICPAEDAGALLGHRTDQTKLPAGVQLVANVEAALDALEAETLARARLTPNAQAEPWPPVLLVARAPERHRQRLQAVLDNGSSFGITGLLLGQWPAGVTAYVRADGTVSATNPGAGERLRDMRMFGLGDDHLADLLSLLRQTESPDESDRQNTPDEPKPGLELLAGKSARDQSHPGLEILSGTADLADPPVPIPPQQRTSATGNQQDALAPLRVTVLGPVRVWWRPRPAQAAESVENEVTSAFQPRVRELLVFLSLHPDGVSREALIAALWPASPPEKTTNALNTSLSRLRRAVSAATDGALSDVVVTGEGRYHLHPGLVEVDYHRFAAAVAARRAATNQQDRIDANRSAVESYAGPLADGMSTEWLETARESIRRDAIDAVAALARALVDQDPQQTLDLLEIARAFDPHNELIYRDIMRLQGRLGQLDAIPRTLTLLTTRLAEVDDQPSPQTIGLCERLQRRHDLQTDAAGHGYSKAG